MFTQDQSATKSYRTLARGSGCRWARTLRVAREQRSRSRRPELRALPLSGTRVSR
jgi:hypothetical protein